VPAGRGALSAIQRGRTAYIGRGVAHAVIHRDLQILRSSRSNCNGSGRDAGGAPHIIDGRHGRVRGFPGQAVGNAELSTAVIREGPVGGEHDILLGSGGCCVRADSDPCQVRVAGSAAHQEQSEANEKSELLGSHESL
jgi:hypothetical protein